MITPAPHLGTPARNAPLDGLRGLGTWFVMMAHLGIASWWWPGLAGVLAVSMFFTLSGYLIATGLLRQLDREGRIGWRRFYARRARRLLPTATVAIALVTVVWWATDRALPRKDVVSSLTYWRNWQLIAESGSYDEVFRDASPFQHFWSLAIEEQFYVFMPALLVGLMVLGKGRRAVAAAGLGAVALMGFVLGGWYDQTDRSRAYYGTEVRAGEFIIGVLLAIAMTTPAVRDRIERVAARPAASWFAGVLAVMSLVFWWRVGFASTGLFPYLMPLNAVITAGLIAYFVTERPRGLSTKIFGWRPVVAIGRRSYSVYVAHWPIYLLIDRAGPAQLGESVVKLVAALAGGFLLFHLVEDPVQRSLAWKTPARLSLGLLSAGILAVGAVTVASATREPPLVDAGAVNRSQDDFFAGLPTTTTTAAGDPAEPTAPPADTGPDTTGPDTSSPDTTSDGTTTPGDHTIELNRVLLVGDSNALTASAWLENNPDELPWTYRWWGGTGCGTTGDTMTRARNEDDGILCPGWLDKLGEAVNAYDPDVVLVVSLAGDLAEHDLGDGRWRTIGDPRYDAFLQERMERFVDLVGATGARVGWFLQPDNAVVDRLTQRIGTGEGWAMNDPVAVDRLNEMIAALAERDPRVVAVPFREWASTWPGGQLDPDFRPDGVHLDGRREDVARWIMQQVSVIAAVSI